MPLDSGKYKKNMEAGAKATNAAADAAVDLKESIRDVLFFARDFADEAKKVTKELGGSTIAASETAKAFKDVAKAAKDITDNYAGVLTGEKKYQDLLKQRGKLESANKSFQTEFEQFLNTISNDAGVINEILSNTSGGIENMFDEIGTDGIDLTELTDSEQKMLDLFLAQNRELKTEADNMSEIAKRAKTIDEAMRPLGKSAISLQDMGEGLSKGLSKAGLGGLGDKLGIEDAITSSRKMAANLTEGGTKALGLGDKMKVAGNMTKMMGGALMKSLGPAAIIAAIVKKIVDAFKMIDGLGAEIAKTQGISAAEGRKQVANANKIAMMSGDNLMNTKDIVKATTSLNALMGTSVEFPAEMALQFAEVQKKLGLSAETMNFFAKNALKGKGSIMEQLETVDAVTTSMNQQNKIGLNMKGIQEGIGKLTASQRLTSKGNLEALTQQVYQSKLLGLSAQNLEGVQNSLLDFESSIAAEMEAELMTGKQLNLEGARAAALAGNQAELAKEIRKEVGSIADFEGMNVMQRQALAKAFGLNIDQMATMLNQQAAMEEMMNATKGQFSSQSEAQAAFNKLVEEGMNAEEAAASMKADGIDSALVAQLKSASMMERMAAMGDKITDMFVMMLGPIMPILDALMDTLDNAIKPMLPTLMLVADILGGMLGPILNTLMVPTQLIMEAFGDIGDMIMSIMPEGTKLAGVFSVIGEILGSLIAIGLIPFQYAIRVITNQVQGLLKIFGGFKKIIEGDLAGGLKDVFGGIIGFITAPFQAFLDMVTYGINMILKGLNKIPLINIPMVPSFKLAELVGLKEGGIIEPSPQGTPSLIGEGGEAEMVLPLSKAKEMGFGGGGNMTETNNLLKSLITAVNSGGDVYLDGNKVGKSLVLATSNMG